MSKPTEFPDPDQLTDADVVIFDGECNFCRSGVQLMRRLDLGGRKLAYISLHDARVAVRYPDLEHSDLMDQMYVVDRNDRRHGGSEAVKYLSRRLPVLWPVMPILHLPGSASLWRWLYHQVARRRYRLAGRTCDSDGCRIHLD